MNAIGPLVQLIMCGTRRNLLVRKAPSSTNQPDQAISLFEQYLLRCFAFVSILFVAGSVFAQDPSRFKSEDVLKLGIVDAHHLDVTSIDDALQLQTTGNDPFIVFDALSKRVASDEETGEEKILAMEYFCVSGLKRLQLRAGPPFRKEAVELPDLPAAEGWTTWSVNLSRLNPNVLGRNSQQWRIDFGTQTDRRLRIRKLFLRDIRPAEKRQLENEDRIRREKETAAAQLAAYYQKSVPAHLRSVRFSDGTVIVEGNVGNLAQRADIAIVVRPAESLASADPSAVARDQAQRVTTFQRNGDFSIEVNQDDWEEAWKPGSVFQIVDLNAEPGHHARSHCRYPDVSLANPDRNVLAPPTLRHAKGLTCITARFQTEQLRELGIQHNSVNIALNGLLSRTPRRGFEPINLRGRQWFANTGKLASLDRNVRTATEAGAVVAGILLIPFQASGDLSLVHPDASSAGTYAMPDLTNAESVLRYAATLDLLAERYTRKGNPHGRIDHWIVHNEVDYGWQWTNMGRQPLELFMDHYIKSMRLVDQCTRRINPHARTFISLTHRWNVPDDQPWKTYAPRTMLRHLIRCCRVEGDFPWGIAYHPYPESLWNSATWNDRNVSDDLDTRLITIRNLPVLQQFVDSTSARTSDGLTRPVLLSEQGFHAPADDETALQRQCAALLYTFEQIRKCPSILAFDYHRPSDHPREGGLMLGLRGLPSREIPLGKPKPAWGVYRAIGTDREPHLHRQYQHHWQNSDPPTQ